MPQPELSASRDLFLHRDLSLYLGGNVRSDWLVERAQRFEGDHFYSDHKEKLRGDPMGAAVT